MVNPSDVLELPGDPVLLLRVETLSVPDYEKREHSVWPELETYNANKRDRVANNACTNIHTMDPCSIQALSKTTQLKSPVQR